VVTYRGNGRAQGFFYRPGWALDHHRPWRARIGSRPIGAEPGGSSRDPGNQIARRECSASPPPPPIGRGGQVTGASGGRADTREHQSGSRASFVQDGAFLSRSAVKTDTQIESTRRLHRDKTSAAGAKADSMFPRSRTPFFQRAELGHDTRPSFTHVPGPSPRLPPGLGLAPGPSSRGYPGGFRPVQGRRQSPP